MPKSSLSGSAPQALPGGRDEPAAQRGVGRDRFLLGPQRIQQAFFLHHVAEHRQERVGAVVLAAQLHQFLVGGERGVFLQDLQVERFGLVEFFRAGVLPGQEAAQGRVGPFAGIERLQPLGANSFSRPSFFSTSAMSG